MFTLPPVRNWTLVRHLYIYTYKKVFFLFPAPFKGSMTLPSCPWTHLVSTAPLHSMTELFPLIWSLLQIHPSLETSRFSGYWSALRPWWRKAFHSAIHTAALLFECLIKSVSTYGFLVRHRRQPWSPPSRPAGCIMTRKRREGRWSLTCFRK